MSERSALLFQAGSVIDGKYRLLRRLGEGSAGAVWQAVNESTRGEVALKLLLRPERELRARLLGEAHACSAIRHKNVVQVYDVGETASGDPFLVMELLVGETLADMLSRRRRLDSKEAAGLGRDVARALAAAHEKSIVHRDLKPANIFLHHTPGEGSPVVKVLDFGVSKNLLGNGAARTAVGAPVGSPSYMSPEQVLSSSDIDGRSDVWSLGVVLFEMLSGVKPFEGDPLEVMQKVAAGPIPCLWHKVRRLDPELSLLVMACLRRDPGQRPWPASEIASQLDAIASLGGRHPAILTVPPARPQPGEALGEDDDDQETRRIPARNLPSPAQDMASRAEEAAPLPGGTVKLSVSESLPLAPPRLPEPALVAAAVRAPVQPGEPGAFALAQRARGAGGTWRVRFSRSPLLAAALAGLAGAALLAAVLIVTVRWSRHRAGESVTPQREAAAAPGAASSEPGAPTPGQAAEPTPGQAAVPTPGQGALPTPGQAVESPVRTGTPLPGTSEPPPPAASSTGAPAATATTEKSKSVSLLPSRTPRTPACHRCRPFKREEPCCPR